MNRTTTNRAPTTPDDHLEDDSHYFTPARAKVRGAVQFCDRMGIVYFKEDIFRLFNVGSREGWTFLSEGPELSFINMTKSYLIFVCCFIFRFD